MGERIEGLPNGQHTEVERDIIEISEEIRSNITTLPPTGRALIEFSAGMEFKLLGHLSESPIIEDEGDIFLETFSAGQKENETGDRGTDTT